MYKVLLVDDEVFVRQGLLSLISWEEFGFEVIAEAGNGEDAFELIEEHSPDLVITDIRMPVVDGLELIKNVHKNLNSDQKFIIVSGYNDFSYAQKAVRFGVLDFILKPIDQEELEETLQKLKEKLDGEKRENTTRKKYMVNQIFVQSLEGNVDDEDMFEWSKALKVEKSDFYHYLLLEINNLNIDAGLSEDGDGEDLKEVIKNTMYRITSNDDHLMMYEQQDNAIGLLIASDDLKKFDGEIVPLGEKLAKEASRKSNKIITAFAGKKIDNLKYLKDSYETANSIRGFKYVLLDQSSICYEDVKVIPVIYNELRNELFVSFMEQLEENSKDEVNETIEKIFKEFQDKSFAPKAIRTTINRCIHGVIERINTMEGNEQELSSLTPMMHWEKYNLTYGELRKLFTAFILDSATYIQELRKENMKGDIYKVKSYMEKNFHENISLKSIASKYYMNPVYMGQLFKKTFGMYFKEYLLQLRIDEARRLLRQTDMRVYEVAEKVGFGSTDYFVTQFEKINKLTPTEYRNELLKK
ncbi:MULTISPECIES: response regulator transcription factor [Bacillaceae]|uniref:Response regulator transcription factor n=1 Tax=Evansella alkalicola TaxID=745819 RepID=A0ABS6JR32_9BACI|nr:MULTISPECIES: response regulator transcription factor [Bacillaceae]MBU9720995.1 response regulator transcription factor [Bacillus alkalicola]